MMVGHMIARYLMAGRTAEGRWLLGHTGSDRMSVEAGVDWRLVVGTAVA